MSAAAAIQRRNRSLYSDVALFAPMDETSGTSTAAQRNRHVRAKIDSIFTKRLREDQTIDSQSTFWVQRLVNQVVAHGSFLNYYSFTLPIYEARWDTPRIHVSDDPPGSQMDLDDSPYKWGTGANVPWEPLWRSADAEAPQAGGYRDRSMVVLDKTNDEAWEFFYVELLGSDFANNPHNYPNIVSKFGGRYAGLSQTFTGVWPSGPGASTGFGTSATTVAYTTLMPRYDELAKGVIPHAIPFSVSLGTAQHRLPATRGDQSGGADDFPEGGRLRLPYDFDIDAWVNTHVCCPLVEMYITAIREYGLACLDASSGVVTLYLEDPRSLWPTTSPPYLSNSNSLLPYQGENVQKTCTGSAATNVITSTGHGMTNGQRILFDAATVGGVNVNRNVAGANVNTIGYYVGSVTTNTFKIYLSSALVTETALGTDITSGFYRKVQSASAMFNTSNFPWGSLLLLPEEAAF